FSLFFFNHPPTPYIYTLSLHDALPIFFSQAQPGNLFAARDAVRALSTNMTGDIVVTLLGGTYALTNSFQLREDATNHDSGTGGRSEEHTSELQSRGHLVCRLLLEKKKI